VVGDGALFLVILHAAECYGVSGTVPSKPHGELLVVGGGPDGVVCVEPRVRLPLHGALHVGAEQELWIQEYTTDPDATNNWRVFDRDGHLLASVATPRRFDMMKIGPNWIAGVWRDELDVEHVRLYDLVKH